MSIAICRMLLTAIWNVLSKLEPYSAKGYLEDKLTEHSVVISKSQGLELLRKRGYIFKDEVSGGWSTGAEQQPRRAQHQALRDGQKELAVCQYSRWRASQCSDLQSD